mmetsp:Transcript_3641/g.11435  ORF Transcript_3641/g.11435 Transcript_3641/m.11435 type:complete len:295 (+) Transcript_3641:814-1698(+)
MELGVPPRGGLGRHEGDVGVLHDRELYLPQLVVRELVHRNEEVPATDVAVGGVDAGEERQPLHGAQEVQAEVDVPVVDRDDEEGPARRAPDRGRLDAVLGHLLQQLRLQRRVGSRVVLVMRRMVVGHVIDVVIVSVTRVVIVVVIDLFVVLVTVVPVVMLIAVVVAADVPGGAVHGARDAEPLVVRVVDPDRLHEAVRLTRHMLVVVAHRPAHGVAGARRLRPRPHGHRAAQKADAEHEAHKQQPQAASPGAATASGAMGGRRRVVHFLRATLEGGLWRGEGTGVATQPCDRRQ